MQRFNLEYLIRCSVDTKDSGCNESIYPDHLRNKINVHQSQESNLDIGQ